MSNTYSKMSESYDKHRNIYVDYLKGKYKPTCLIHGPGNSSDKYKVLGDFGSKYAKIRHTDNRGHNHESINKYTRQKYSNTIVNSTVYEIILQEDNKVSPEIEAQDIIESDFDDNYLYRIDNMSQKEKKENLNYISVSLNAKSRSHIILKSRMI